MDTKVKAHVATFRVFSSSPKPMSAPSGSHKAVGAPPPSRKYWMGATTVTEGPLVLSRLASNEINYLQVNNFTRAIMPRSKIWRVSKTELVIPASHTNYWLITLQGAERWIAQLDQILRGLCKYEVSSVDDEDIEFDLDEELLNASYAEFLEATEANSDLASRKRSDVVFGPLLSRYEEGHHRERDRESLASSAKRTISLGNAKTVLSESISNDPLSRKNALTVKDTPGKTPNSPSRSAPSQRVLVLYSPETSHEHDERNELFTSTYASSPQPIAALNTPPSSPEQFPTPSAKSISCSSTPLNEHFGKLEKDSGAQSTASTRRKTAAPSEMDASREDFQNPSDDRTHSLQQDTSERHESDITPRVDMGPEEISPTESLVQKPLSSQHAIAPPEHNAHTTTKIEVTLEKAMNSLEPRFEPRFSHPLIPSSHVSRYYPTNPGNGPLIRPRISLQRRDLTTIGPSTLHQDVTTVGGYIGLKAVKGLLRRT